MSLQRILQMLASFFTSQGVSLVAQLIIPPIFLSRYSAGMEAYGEWIALSAAVGYLGTLNYGVQTYAYNQITIYYNRNELDAAQSLQSSALRLLLLITGCLAIAGTSVLVAPIGRWLSLTHESSRAASLTLFLLILQVSLNMILALLANSYMVIGKMHRGANWMTLQRLTSTLAVAASAWFKSSFPFLALVQLICVPLFTFCVLIDIKRTAPFLIPSISRGSWSQVRSILKPSVHFGILALSQFLTWQAPVLLIQKQLGPSSVTVFSLARTIFSIGRQILIIVSYSIGQEITLLIAERNWQKLKRLYDLSERVILLLVPIVSVGVLLISPLIFSVWLHQRTLYNPSLCLMMALVSAVMGIKEHKYQFQASSNEHVSLSRFTLCTYAVMLLISPLLLRYFGILGFMCAWLAAEVTQTAFIFRLNRRLFPMDMPVSVVPILRLAGVLAVAFGVAAWPAFASVNWNLVGVVSVAVSITSSITVGSYFAFDLREVRSVLFSKFRKRISVPPSE